MKSKIGYKKGLQLFALNYNCKQHILKCLLKKKKAQILRGCLVGLCLKHNTPPPHARNTK